MQPTGGRASENQARKKGSEDEQDLMRQAACVSLCVQADVWVVGGHSSTSVGLSSFTDTMSSMAQATSQAEGPPFRTGLATITAQDFLASTS